MKRYHRVTPGKVLYLDKRDLHDPEQERRELEKKVIEMYLDPKTSVFKIQGKLQITRNYIYIILHKNNIKLKGVIKLDSKKEKEIIKKYGKLIRRKYTDEELEPHSKPLTKLHNKKEIIKKWGKKKCG